jgi:UDP:flavonoid glycosyltransferase YjiC (YdhE family)
MINTPGNLNRKKILFFCEAITFAHITRLSTLANFLSGNEYEIHFACADFPDSVFNKLNFTRWEIYSLSPEKFREALAKGKETHSFELLKKYVSDDLLVIDKVKPDLIVGDFRLSLAVSARKANIPYINITNAYWSPYHNLKKLPVIDLPVFNKLGERFGAWVFSKSMYLISKALIKPYNKLHQYYGYKGYKNHYEVYTDGDLTLYCDVPELIPTSNLPASHAYIGPVFWPAHIDMPDWSKDVPLNKTIVFLSMGSSGNPKILPEVIEYLSQLDIVVLVATSWYSCNTQKSNVFIADYLPLNWVSGIANIFIVNGGVISYHALNHGIPVIGITTNFDQQLCMEHIVLAGAGISIKGGTFSIKNFMKQFNILMNNESYKKNAKSIMKSFASRNTTELFEKAVKSLIQ